MALQMRGSGIRMSSGSIKAKHSAVLGATGYYQLLRNRVWIRLLS